MQLIDQMHYAVFVLVSLSDKHSVHGISTMTNGNESKYLINNNRAHYLKLATVYTSTASQIKHSKVSRPTKLTIARLK